MVVFLSFDLDTLLSLCDTLAHGSLLSPIALFQIDTSGDGALLGPYCGIHPKWYMFSLLPVAMVIYKGCNDNFISCEAHIQFMYHIMESTVLNYTDESIVVGHKPMKATADLEDNSHRPSIIFREYEVYHWQIRILVYHRLKITIHPTGVRQNSSKSHIAIYEGPSHYVEDLCIFKEYVHSISKQVSAFTQTFQAVVSLMLKRNNLHRHSILYTREHAAKGKYKPIADREHFQIKFPGPDCSMIKPVTFCQWNFKSMTKKYVTVKIEKLSHTAPVNDLCQHFGIAVVNIPNHIVGIFFHNTPFYPLFAPFEPSDYKSFTDREIPYSSLDKYRDIFQDIYTSHFVCDMGWVENLPQGNHQKNSIFSTSSLVMIFIYAYSPFLITTPEIRLIIESSTYQNVPLNLPLLEKYPSMQALYRLAPKNIILSDHELTESQMIQEAQKVCISYSRELKQSRKIMDIEVARGLVHWGSDTFYYRKYQYNHVSLYENFIQCSTTENKSSTMYVGVKRGIAVIVTASPISSHANKYNTILYLTGIKNPKPTFYLSQFHIDVTSGEMEYKEINRISTTSIKYPFNKNSYFVLSTEKSCEREVSAGNQKIVFGQCSTVNIVTGQYRKTFLISWLIPGVTYVITLRYRNKACLSDYSILLLLEGAGHVVILPKTTHDLNIYTHTILTIKSTTLLNILLKASYLKALKGEVCHLLYKKLDHWYFVCM